MCEVRSKRYLGEVVLRHLNTLLEPSKQAVLHKLKFQLAKMRATELDNAPLKEASGYVFYNTSKWTLQHLFGSATK